MNDEMKDQTNRRGARGQDVGLRGSADADNNSCSGEGDIGPGSSL